MFGFDDPILDWTLEYSMTAWTSGMLGRRADGAFTYDSGTGYTSNSLDFPDQYALFRRVTPEYTEYIPGSRGCPGEYLVERQGLQRFHRVVHSANAFGTGAVDAAPSRGLGLGIGGGECAQAASSPKRGCPSCLRSRLNRKKSQPLSHDGPD